MYHGFIPKILRIEFCVFNPIVYCYKIRYVYFWIHSVKKQVQLHFSCTAVSSEDSSATDLLMLQTQYKIVHVCTGTYMHTVYAMGWFAI